MADLKTSRVLLPDAERSETTATALQTDIWAAALRFYLNVTYAPASGGLQVVLRGYDKASGNSVELSTGGVPVQDSGTYCYEATSSPSDPASGAIRESVARAIPYQWDALVKHADNAPCRYSLSVEIVK